MISNPGSSPVSTLMDKSIYDKNNKNTDIFAYTDSKVSDKVTSAQVAAQISNATSSFVTSSVVDQKIANSGHIPRTDPFLWQCTELISLSFSSPTTLSSLDTSSTSMFCPLPVPMQIDRYDYQVQMIVFGLMPYGITKPSSISSTPSLDCYLTENNSGSANAYEIAKVLSLTRWANNATQKISPQYTLFSEMYITSDSLLFSTFGNFAALSSESSTASTYKYQGQTGNQGLYTGKAAKTIHYVKIRNRTAYTNITTCGILFSYKAIRAR